MRILIAEADQALAERLAAALRPMGAAVDHVASGSQAEAALLSNPLYDLLILELNLPRLHGLDVLKRLRARGQKLPVLIISTADSVTDRVRGLDSGADDYMPKPPALPELQARVRALLRRSMGAASPTIRHGRLQYDQTSRACTIGGRALQLSARELAVLETLLQRQGRPISKEQLVEHLYGWGEEITLNAIEVYIHRLRKKLGAHGIQITTLRGLGYCLEKTAPEDEG